jgi:AraC-like DNA-binding protein
MQNWIFSIFPNETFVDLGLYQFGWEKCSPAHSYGPASRNHYLFHYVISGTGELKTEDTKGEPHTYQIKSGQGFMIFPGQITTYTADLNLPWEYVWLEFDGLRVKEAIEISGLSKNFPVYHARSKNIREEMMNEMLYIVHHKDESPLHIVGHLYLFLDCLTRSSMNENFSKGTKLQDFYLRQSISFIERNFQNDISVEDIASFCGLNRSYFGKIFKKAVGKTPQEFLTNYRMIKATELLKLTQLSIGDISNAIGYADQLHFSRAFKKIYGMSPRDWRKKNRIHPQSQK